MRLLVIFSCLFLSCSLSTANCLAAEFSFDQAWQRLQNISDSLAAERAGIENAEFKQKAAKSLYYPQIDISAQYIRLDNDIELTADMLFDSMPNNGAAAKGIIENLGHVLGPMNMDDFTSTLADKDTFHSGISLTWPIYAGGRIDAAQEIALGRVHEANQHKTMVERQHFSMLSKRYFGVILTEMIFQTRHLVALGLKQHLHNATLLEKHGQIAKVERLQAAASYDKAKVESKKAERNLEITRKALASMLKTSPDLIPVDSLFANNEIPPLENFIIKTQNSYPLLGILKSKKEQAEGLVKIEKGKFHPEVAMLGNYSIYESESLATELAPDWFVGLNVKFTLVDRGGRFAKVDAAHSSIRQLDSMIAQGKKDLAIASEQYYLQAKQALEEYNGLTSSLELAEEGLKLRNKAFKQGLATSLDVVDAELFLAGVKIQKAVALYSYIQSLSQLLVLSGEISQFPHYQQIATVHP
ncbi:MAG: TolC family protein [Desulfotalea sp.]